MDNDQLNNDITDTAAFDNFDNDAIIKVIGVGGGGGNAVNYMYRQNIPNVNFVVCNTDKQALSVSPVPNKLILGYDITHGRGAGNKPDVGRACAEASADDIRKLFDDQTEMVFITAGMGGGRHRSCPRSGTHCPRCRYAHYRNRYRTVPFRG